MVEMTMSTENTVSKVLERLHSLDELQQVGGLTLLGTSLFNKSITVEEAQPLLPALESLLDKPIAISVFAAVYISMVSPKNEKIQPILEEGLRHNDTCIYAAGAIANAKLPDANAITALALFIENPNYVECRPAALMALQRFGKRA